MKVICVEDYEFDGVKIERGKMYDHCIDSLCITRKNNRRHSGASFYRVRLYEYNSQQDILENLKEEYITRKHLTRIRNTDYVIETENGAMCLSYFVFVRVCKKAVKHRNKAIDKIIK